MDGRRSFFLLLLLVAAELRHLEAEQSYDYPTAKAPATWTNSRNLPHTIQYPGGITIKALLLRSPPERYGPSFACGFYCRSRATGAACTDYLFAVFLVYTNSGALITSVDVFVAQVVWSANRNRPVKENAVLQLAADGNLVLKDADGTLVWSTNTGGKSVASVSITAAGNLVLLDQKGAIVWQSFDHPTDALLPGQRLVDGQSLYSNVSGYDWREGLYTLTATSTGFNAAVRTDPPELYYQEGSSASPSMTGNYILFQNGSLSFFRRSSPEPTSTVPLPPAPSVQYVRLELDGHLRVYQWRPDEGGWKAVAEVIRFYAVGDCGFPTACGAYGICSAGQCSCPRDPRNRTVNYFLPVNDRRPDFGCEPVVAISCRRARLQRMLRLEDVAYFASVDARVLARGVKSLDGCSSACLKRCSCRGAFFRYGADPANGDCYLVPRVLTMMDHDRDARHYNFTGFVKVQLA